MASKPTKTESASLIAIAKKMKIYILPLFFFTSFVFAGSGSYTDYLTEHPTLKMEKAEFLQEKLYEIAVQKAMYDLKSDDYAPGETRRAKSALKGNDGAKYARLALRSIYNSCKSTYNSLKLNDQECGIASMIYEDREDKFYAKSVSKFFSMEMYKNISGKDLPDNQYKESCGDVNGSVTCEVTLDVMNNDVNKRKIKIVTSSSGNGNIIESSIIIDGKKSIGKKILSLDFNNPKDI